MKVRPLVCASFSFFSFPLHPFTPSLFHPSRFPPQPAYFLRAEILRHPSHHEHRDMTCPNCSETIADDSDACPACGRLHSPLECERHPEREANGHCVICGTAVCDECNH